MGMDKAGLEELAGKPRAILGMGDIRHDHDKLITPQTGRGVATAQDPLEARGDGLQEQIATTVTQGIVDVLKTVEIKEQERAALLIPPCPLQGLV